jgi:chromate transporter
VPVALVFLRLGCLSFGGPIAHLSYFRAEIVEKLGWIDDDAYGDLVALCQFLPGPASSQVVFAIGMHSAGFWGACAALFCFTLPSALLMIALAYGLAALAELRDVAWIHGLKLAAVAVVARAVWGMGKALCPDPARLCVCLLSACLLLSNPGGAAQLGVIVASALFGWWYYRTKVEGGSLPADGGAHRSHPVASLALVLFVALLVMLPVLGSLTESRALAVFDSFYRSGALVFGGGHVVLPLLRAEVVPRGWVSDDQFLAGYGAAQALPGPLFSFAAYLGAAMERGAQRWVMGIWCLLSMYLPALLLVGGALPFWQRARATVWARAALMGANASVVGVLLAALYDPVITESVHGAKDVALALAAFGLLEYWKAPPWLVILVMATAGALL